MTCKISCSVLALGLLAALSSPGHAGLSTTDRPGAVEAPAAAAPAPVPEQATEPAPRPHARAAVAAVPPAAEPPRKTVVHTARPRRLSVRRSFGYPCH